MNDALSVSGSSTPVEVPVSSSQTAMERPRHRPPVCHRPPPLMVLRPDRQRFLGTSAPGGSRPREPSRGLYGGSTARPRTRVEADDERKASLRIPWCPAKMAGVSFSAGSIAGVVSSPHVLGRGATEWVLLMASSGCWGPSARGAGPTIDRVARLVVIQADFLMPDCGALTAACSWSSPVPGCSRCFARRSRYSGDARDALRRGHSAHVEASEASPYAIAKS
jgi:hypothetical protein